MFFNKLEFLKFDGKDKKKKCIGQTFRQKICIVWLKNCIFAPRMNSLFPIEINILDFIFKGIVIGIIASAPWVQ